MRTRLAVALALLLLLAACGGGDGGATTTITPPATTAAPLPTTTTLATTTSSLSLVTTTPPSTTAPGPEIDVYVDAGQVVGPESFSFSVGDEVSIWVLSDVDEEVHVHGYDVTFNAKAGVPLEISLIADVPGVFEVELEGSHLLLFELVVS
jgi:hypothetical protein